MQLRFSGALVAALLTSVGFAQTDLPAPGLSQTGTRTLTFASDPCGFVGLSALGVEALLSDGRIVRFTGEELEVLAPDGSPLSTLAVLPGPVFPSFLRVDPSETFAVFGESCSGNIQTVDLATGVVQPVAQIAFNYDAVFDLDPTLLWVSASGSATSGRNRIYSVDLPTGLVRQRGRVGGFSGPLALDEEGWLHYATQGFPIDVIKWSPQLLASGAMLREGNASLVRSDLGSASGLAFDPTSGNLVVNRFQDLLLLAPDGSSLGVLVEADSASGTFLGNVQIAHSGGTASLQPFQPANAVLHYTATDFFSFAERRTCVPARAQATLSGPTSGPATKTLTITGAHPNTRVLVYFNTRTFFNPAEYVFGSFDFPFHSALPLERSRHLHPALITDGQGTATFTYDDPGTLHGNLVFQALIRGSNGETVGTSTYALN